MILVLVRSIELEMPPWPLCRLWLEVSAPSDLPLMYLETIFCVPKMPGLRPIYSSVVSEAFLVLNFTETCEPRCHLPPAAPVVVVWQMNSFSEKRLLFLRTRLYFAVFGDLLPPGRSFHFYHLSHCEREALMPPLRSFGRIDFFLDRTGVFSSRCSFL